MLNFKPGEPAKPVKPKKATKTYANQLRGRIEDLAYEAAANGILFIGVLGPDTPGDGPTCITGLAPSSDEIASILEGNATVVRAIGAHGD